MPGVIEELLSKRMRGLLTGEKKPWELPEFKGMEYTLAKRGALARAGTGRELRRRGIRGPAVASTMRGMEEMETAPLGDVMKSTYGAIPERAMGLANLEQMATQRAFEGYQAHRQRKLQRAQIASQSCCFIFIEADDGKLDRVARRYRDEKGTPEARSGYRRLANWLVPKMRESKTIKNLVKFFMVRPMLGAGGFVYRENHWGYLFVPLAMVWMMAFEVLGMRKNHGIS